MNEIMLEDFRDDQFYYFHQEAYLAKTLLYDGLLALYLSSFGHTSGLGKAQQYQAFFNLSISLERLEKLALIFYELDKNNILPQGDVIRKKGHDLKKLFNELQNLSSNVHQSFFNLPQISMDILELLTDFAKRTRYENLDRLSGASSNINKEPVQEFDKILKSIEQDYQNHKFKGRLDKLAERIDLDNSSDNILKNKNNILILSSLKDNQNNQITCLDLEEQKKIRITSFPLTYFYILQVFRPVIAVLNEWNKSYYESKEESLLLSQAMFWVSNLSEKHPLYDSDRIKNLASNGSNSQQNSKLDVPDIFNIFKKNKFIEIDDVSIILDFLEENKNNQIYNWFAIVGD